MSENYWKTHFDRLSKIEDPLKQVGKTVDGIPVGLEQIKILLGHIVENLELTHDDKLIDLCCGNGLLTELLSKKAKDVTGVDFSTGLIDSASNNSSGAVQYINKDIMKLEGEFFRNSNKIVMYEGLQHLPHDALYPLLSKLKGSSCFNKFFIGGVPDKERISDYYDTPEKMSFFNECERLGNSHMGKWWTFREIDLVANNVGLRATKVNQDRRLYTSYYRFDCLIERVENE